MLRAKGNAAAKYCNDPIQQFCSVQRHQAWQTYLDGWTALTDCCAGTSGVQDNKTQ